MDSVNDKAIQFSKLVNDALNEVAPFKTLLSYLFKGGHCVQVTQSKYDV